MAQQLKAKAAIKEGASEIGGRLREDIGGLGKFRRGVTLKSTMDCLDCRASGKADCSSCDGTGKSKVVWGEEAQNCATCSGTGKVTCPECAGRGFIYNQHRAKLLWVLIVGFLMWGIVAYMVWGNNLFPEERAKYLGKGGGRIMPERQGGGRSTGKPGEGMLHQPGASGTTQEGIRQGNPATGGGFSTGTTSSGGLSTGP